MPALSRERSSGFPRRTSASRTDHNEALSEYFSAVLQYHFTPLEWVDYCREQAPTIEEAQALGLMKTLRYAFWQTVFEDEHAAERIITKVRAGRVLLVQGLRGTGKTTAMHHLIRHVAMGSGSVLEGVDIHYYDILGLRYRLGEGSADDKNDLCSFIAENLIENYCDSGAGREAWQQYQISNLKTFQTVRERLRKREVPPADWATTVRADDSLDAIFDSCVDAYLRSRGEIRMFDVLTHLSEQEQKICLLIDNLDQMSSAFQSAVGEHLGRLTRGGAGPLFSAITALRPENIQRTLANLGGVEADVVELNLEDLSPETSAVDGDRLGRIAERRLDFLRRYPMDAFFEERQIRRSAQLRRLGSTAKLREHLAELNDFIRVVLTGDRLMSQALYYWHNGSVRHSLMSAASVVEAVLLDQPDVMGLNEAQQFSSLLRRTSLREAPDSRRARSGLRVARSVVYRHLLFSEYTADRPSSGHPVSLLLSQTSPKSGACPYPELVILASVERGGGKMTLKHLEDDLHQMGIAFDESSLAITRLSARRVSDDEGFIRIIDGHDQEAQLTLAGRFLYQRLLPTCEYLFWCAAARYGPSAVSPESKRPEGFGDESYRIETVHRFLEKRVIPDLVQYRSWLEDHQNRRGQDLVNRVTNSLCDGYLGFVRTSQDHRSEARWRAAALDEAGRVA